MTSMNYLYNGIELPKLPEWDKEKYPYAVISYTDIGYSKYYLLRVFSALDYSPYTDNWGLMYYNDNARAKCVVEESGVSAEEPLSWGDFEYTEGNADSTVVFGFSGVKWTNTDLLNADGSVSLAASYPIDAETGEEIHDYEIGNTEPETPEPEIFDFYRRKGGKWVKQCSYKRASGAWAKQDAYRLS